MHKIHVLDDDKRKQELLSIAAALDALRQRAHAAGEDLIAFMIANALSAARTRATTPRGDERR